MCVTGVALFDLPPRGPIVRPFDIIYDINYLTKRVVNNDIV